MHNSTTLSRFLARTAALCPPHALSWHAACPPASTRKFRNTFGSDSNPNRKQLSLSLFPVSCSFTQRTTPSTRQRALAVLGVGCSCY